MKKAGSLFRLSVLLVLLTTAACGHADPVVPDPKTGNGLVYQLASRSGEALPVTTALSPFRVELLKGALTLSPDSTWLMSLVERHTGQGTQFVTSTDSRGTYSRTGQALSLTILGLPNVSYTGTWAALDVVVSESANGSPLLAFHRE